MGAVGGIHINLEFMPRNYISGPDEDGNIEDPREWLKTALYEQFSKINDIYKTKMNQEQRDEFHRVCAPLTDIDEEIFEYEDKHAMSSALIDLSTRDEELELQNILKEFFAKLQREIGEK